MSASKNDGGPAFPYGQRNFTDRYSEGMSLRDWFAGQAINSGWSCGLSSSEAAEWAYKYADAMLAKRSKKGHKS